VCDDLKKTKVDKNTYTFTTDVTVTGFAEVVKLEYFANGELFDTTASPDEPTEELVITEDTTVVVKVTVSLPGDQTKVIESEACKRHLEFEKEVVPEKPKEEKPKVMPAAVVKVSAPKQPLPVTGPDGMAGLFFGTALAGAVSHRLYTVYRAQKQIK
jgi:hypothetical protein